MKKFVAIALMIGMFGVASAQEVTLRIGHFISPMGTVPAGFIEPWAEKVTEESDGRIQFEIFPAGQLAPAPAVYDGIRDGIMDIGWILPGYSAGRFPMSEVFELPFISAQDAEITSQALWDFYENNMQEEFSEVHPIAFHVHAGGLFHMKGDPITSIQDLQGRTIRAPTRAMNAALGYVGAEPVGMPVPQVPEAVSRGVVDGTVLPYEIIPSLKLHELVDSHSAFESDRALYTSTFIFGMNKDAYASLPDDLKAIIDNNSGLETSRWVGQVTQAGEDVGLAAAQGNENDFYTLSDTDQALWILQTQPVVDEWVTLMNDAGFDGEALLQEARDLVAMYEAAAAE